MASPLWRGTTALVEDPRSPLWVFGERITLTRVFAGQHAACLAAAPLKGFGGTGIAAGYIVEESRVERDRGGQGKLTIQYTLPGGAAPGQGAQLPPNEVEFQNERLELALQKHPRYAGIGEALLRDINVVIESTNESTKTDPLTRINANALAKELYGKLQKGNTHYFIYAPVYRVVSHWWGPPSTSGGGYLETPPSVLSVSLPSGLQWLREGDRLAFNGATWQLERKWIGVPEWDAQLYTT